MGSFNCCLLASFKRKLTWCLGGMYAFSSRFGFVWFTEIKLKYFVTLLQEKKSYINYIHGYFFILLHNVLCYKLDLKYHFVLLYLRIRSNHQVFHSPSSLDSIPFLHPPAQHSVWSLQWSYLWLCFFQLHWVPAVQISLLDKHIQIFS